MNTKMPTFPPPGSRPPPSPAPPPPRGVIDLERELGVVRAERDLLRTSLDQERLRVVDKQKEIDAIRSATEGIVARAEAVMKGASDAMQSVTDDNTALHEAVDMFIEALKMRPRDASWELYVAGMIHIWERNVAKAGAKQ